ncbi:hypothetical protein [Prochlorococcus sp. MIT 1223]|uniref:hypothetical protein n=1 Tax=Prochlorococcus sp. MIT 1223 TaxID=3096217 RepID=UPI002A75C65F|nr:hypothetical protein [Prochlorococcus sp. MIT 1223]
MSDFAEFQLIVEYNDSSEVKLFQKEIEEILWRKSEEGTLNKVRIGWTPMQGF